ncbi:hypothetical protein JAAARDRAFT_156640 [Jaapia argillacea MUCL 33604]|uniref:RING-type E3 ubiquitin transferase n=1 Tax=Jaapia argillacea MUCL 33604 TaxID=933084 RepID=A0A067PSC1_9AGAM|nr:hypothetical protein JAAARDRAFT_156640 [Jaapia argillacea MUCL 33604]
MPIHAFIRQRVQPAVSALTSYFFLYAIISCGAVVAAILNALKYHSNFYSVAIFMSKSSRSVLILANFGFLIALLCGRVMQQIFLGSLQPREVERLYDRMWFFVTESLLAFTIFRDEFDFPFAFMFGFLLFVKCFHWLMADRIETMDQVPYPGPPLLFHIRMNCLFAILSLTDFVMFVFAVESTLAHGVGGTLLFASEYAILMASALNAMAKYILSVIDLRRARSRGGVNAPPWENKSMHVFYIELATDFLKLSTYLAFCALIITFYGLPLNILRDVYMTASSFITRLRALNRYHTATRNMDQRYPNATEEEMATMSDRTCIICREEMVLPTAAQATVPDGGTQAQAPAMDGPNTTPKKLPCGHIFHFHCLRSWLERQQSCPTCRRTVLETTPSAGRQGAQVGGRAAAPQPGAAPAPNLFNFFGQQPQPGQQPPNQPVQQPGNPGGFLGRLFGIPPQPQNAGGQFAPPGAPPAAGIVPGQIPADLGWQHVPQMVHHQPVLHAPPMFQGFYGPGGIWQPWGMDAQWFAQAPGQVPQGLGQAQRQGTEAPPATSANPPATSAVGVSMTPTPTQTAPAGYSSATTDSAPQMNANDGTSTPRDAAALAAMRRYNSSRPAGLSSDSRSTSSTSVGKSTSVEISSSTSAASQPQPNISTSTSDPSTSQPPPPASTSAPNGIPPSTDVNHEMRPEIPPLIPLYDFTPYPRYAQSPFTPPPYGGPMPSQRPTTTAHGQPGTSQTQAGPGSGFRTPFRAPPASYFSSSRLLNAVQQRAAGTAPASRPSLSRLPETLTDEQLGRLDSLTRDAIDERIRVLEGVSGAVSRCVEELMRVRSILPPRADSRDFTRSRAGSSSSHPNPTATTQADPAAPRSVASPPPEHEGNGIIGTAELDDLLATAREALREAKLDEAIQSTADLTVGESSSQAAPVAQDEATGDSEEGTK